MLDGLLVGFNVIGELVQAEFKFRILQSLHNHSTRFGHPKILTGFHDIIFHVSLLGYPEPAIQTANYISAPVAIYIPKPVFIEGNIGIKIVL